MESSQIKDLIMSMIKEAMKDVFDSAIQSKSKELENRMKRCMEEMVEETSNEAVKRIKADLVPKFKNPGNKDQYDHVQAIKSSMDEAITTLGAKNIQKAKEKLEQGKSLITEQIELIKLADREEDGWEVVKFYKTDDLADNSEDEKNISKAKKLAAVAKKKKGRDRYEKMRHTLSGETLSGETFVGRNYSSGEIFVTKRKIRHFRPTKSFAQ